MSALSALWTTPTRRALRNARDATVSLARTVADRLELTDALDEEVADEPGGLHAMSRADCYDVLRKGSVARLAYVARAGSPDIVPVNYLVDGEDLLIRSGPGPKLQAAERREVVAVETDVLDEHSRTARSVVVVGRAQRVGAREERELAERLTPWAAGARRHVIRIRPTRVTGRRLSRATSPGGRRRRRTRRCARAGRRR